MKIWQYRTFSNWEVVLLKSYDEEFGFFCQAVWYEDSYHYDKKYLKKNSKPSTWDEIKQYQEQILLLNK